jgi:hypothetical protein
MAEPRIGSQVTSDIWEGFRPYLVKIAIDFLISASLWVVLFLFKALTKLLAIGGWAGDFIVNLHATGAVAAYGIFAILFATDLYTLHREKLRKAGDHD